MLESLRKGAGTWVAKIFLGILVLSFAVWGVADVFTGYGSTTLAKVGDREISTDQYEQAYQDALQRFQQQIGQRITSDQARALGLDRQVLAGLVGEAAVEQHATALGLGISQESAVEQIRRVPGFQNPDGSFNRLRFLETLRQSGMSEQRFVAEQRRQAIRNQITNALRNEAGTPAILVDAVNTYENETRTLAHFALPADKAGDITPADDARLKELYDSDSARFTAPERRSLAVLIVDPEGLADKIAISDEDLKAAYEAEKDSFVTPERRTVQQIAFPDLAAAQAAHAELVAGKDFVAVATAAGATEADISLGSLSRDAMADAKIAEAAFGLAKDAFSPPVQGALTTAIVRVTAIEPRIEQSFEAVKDELLKRLRIEHATAEIQDLFDKIEDERGAGSTLKEIGDRLSLKYAEISPVDLEGRLEDETKPADLLAADRVLPVVFESDVGVENDPAEIPGGGYIWFDVTGVVPAKLKDLEAVKAEVGMLYAQRERERALSKLAQDLVDRLNKGESLETIAGEFGATVTTSAPMKRRATDPDIPSAAIAVAFTLAANGAGAASLPDNKGRIVFQVREISAAPALEEAARKQLVATLANQVDEELLGQYVGALQTRYGLTINQTNLDRLRGVTPQ